MESCPKNYQEEEIYLCRKSHYPLISSISLDIAHNNFWIYPKNLMIL